MFSLMLSSLLLSLQQRDFGRRVVVALTSLKLRMVSLMSRMQPGNSKKRLEKRSGASFQLLLLIRGSSCRDGLCQPDSGGELA